MNAYRTGRTRYRLERKSPYNDERILVLQVEETTLASSSEDCVTTWRDATVEDLTVQNGDAPLLAVDYGRASA